MIHMKGLTQNHQKLDKKKDEISNYIISDNTPFNNWSLFFNGFLF